MVLTKKIAVVITDGVGYRNFIMSDFMSEIEHNFQSISIYSGLPSSVFDKMVFSEKIKVFELEVFNEKKITWFFRKWKEIAHLTKFKTFAGMQENLTLGFPTCNSLSAIALKIIYAITAVWHSNNSIFFAEKMQFFTFATNSVTKSYFALLENDQPDLVFFTHQRPSYLAPLLFAVLKRNIKTATFIFSWDNLSSKGRMLGSFDYFLAWSDLMQTEVLHFYDTVNVSRVSVVGTPQFEPYVLARYKTTRNHFLSKFDLDSAQKIICFSCADISIGSNDSMIIGSIIDAIRSAKILNAQLLVRTSPAESPDRFQHIIDNYPDIKWNFPKWKSVRDGHSEAWSQRIPTQEDIEDLRAILEYSDISINMCSTMSLDFMIFDKPVINTVFGNKTNGLYNDQRFLTYDHFKKVVDSNSVIIAKNSHELIAAINHYLLNPFKNSDDRAKMIQLQISKSLKGTSKRIASQLASISHVQ